MWGDTLGGHDETTLEEYLEAVDLEAIDLKEIKLEAVNLEVVNMEAVDWEAFAMEAETLFIGSPLIVGMWRIEYDEVR